MRGPDALLRAAASVPSLPRIYNRLTEALDNPRTSTGHIAAIISSDTGLAARLLRLVNSAFYAFPTRTDSISHAVVLVGTEQIRDLALATAVLQVFNTVSPELVDMESFWLHGIATGVAARLLATQCGIVGTERFFVAGVLHDIGRLLMLKTWPEETGRALVRAKDSSEPLVEIEREMFGFDHAAAGGEVLDAWHLSPSLAAMTRYHHNPADAPDDPAHVAVVHTANVIVSALELGNSGDHAVPHLEPTAYESLALPPGTLVAVAGQIECQVEEVRHSILARA